MLTASQLLDALLERARTLQPTETVAVTEALGRVLADPVVSAITVPPLDNSAMDGYAVRVADVPAAGTRLPLSQRIQAGAVGETLAAGTAARIFTGAPVPPGADAVLMQEMCAADGDAVVINKRPVVGENIRLAGEDIRAGAAILAAGTRIGAAEMGLVASVGLGELSVLRRLKVACFFTGDELATPGTPLGPGQIYNSNRYTLTGLLQGLGCELIDLGIVADTAAATEDALTRAAREADVVITSGGVSVGEADCVKAAVEKLGRIEMWKVAMKPGKPIVYGRVGEADFIGLPGNPAAVFSTFCLFVRPFLLRRMGATDVLYRAYPMRCASAWTKPGDRREFLRARIGEDGALIIYPNQSSGVLTSCAWGDGFIDLDIGQTIAAGDWVRFIPFAGVLG
ncbi:MAG: molybdopterin molybdotransferase MoeA [Thiobacillus sp.]|nr:molybdopterin molybdotransferase MoeA [Thiobacillus sp.]